MSPLDSPLVLGLWALVSAVCVAAVAWDLLRANRQLGGLMKLVWLLTVAYSGILGLFAYRYAGRGQIPRDTLPRRGVRSTAHCYSGCGAGEIVGVVTSVGLFSAGQYVAAAITFALAYAFGIALTAGPLMREGVARGRALKDAFITESASIVVMEAVAIGVDFILAGDAGLTDVRFWSSLVVSLSLGFLAAFPVNLGLIRGGVKQGMGHPGAA